MANIISCELTGTPGEWLEILTLYIKAREENIPYIDFPEGLVEETGSGMPLDIVETLLHDILPPKLEEAAKVMFQYFKKLADNNQLEGCKIKNKPELTLVKDER